MAEEPATAINSLTQDEDERQELWIHYLEGGNDLNALTSHLANIRRVNSEAELLQIVLWKRITNYSQLATLDIFDRFTDLEQTVMRLLVLGATLEEIGSIIKISVIRLRHVVSVIRKHEVWIGQ